ncbi:cupin domain-containing protein [Vibrio gangliei]|uniref:hypothetical protein n=1 Tax=Vibrio gangliei TaxID=2077090 RepID=UPI000D016407|nr:hypothetical protein [Vibrio gangliei]
MIELKGLVRFGDWGGWHFVPQLLMIQSCKQAISSLCFSDNPRYSASLVDGSLLSNWLSLAPDIRIGSETLKQYGARIPFEFSLLDTQRPCGLRVHPDALKAQQGYDFENKRNTPYSIRLYKDGYSKPQLRLAISDSYLLVGFKDPLAALCELKRYKDLAPYVLVLEEYGIRGLLRYLIHQNPTEIESALCPLKAQYQDAFLQNELPKSEALYWFMALAKRYEEQARTVDWVLVALFLMNLIYLPKEQAVYISPGTLYADLFGQVLAVTNLSNNTLSTDGELTWQQTQQMVDALNVEHQEIMFLDKQDVAPVGQAYSIPNDHFSMQEFRLMPGQSLVTPMTDYPCYWLVLNGEVKVNSQLHYSLPGSVFYQKPNEINSIKAFSNSVIYRISQ